MFFKNLYVSAILVLLLLLFKGNTALGQQLRMSHDIQYGKLSNGISYFLVPEGKPGKVEVQAYTKVGAYLERPDQHGYAHMIEHMLFEGSENYPRGECREAMELMGMRIALDYNAHTGIGDTRYFMTIPENDKDYLQRSLRILKDWMFYLKLEEEGLENEKKVITEELNRAGKSRLGGSVNLLGTSLEGHDVLGTKESVQSATAEGLYRFYRDNYTPENIAIIVYGKMDPEFAEASIQQVFESIPADTNRRANQYIDVNSADIVSGKAISSGGEDLTLAVLFKAKPAVIDSYPAFKRELVDILLCDMMERRLERSLGKSISSASVNIGSMLPGNSIYNYRMKFPAAGNYQTVFEQFCYLLAQAKQHGFSQAEIDYFSELKLEYFTRARRENSPHINGVYQFFKNGDVPLDREQRLKLTQQAIEELTPLDFAASLERMLELKKTLLFDSTAAAYTPEFNKDYLLGTLNRLDTIDTEEFVFARPNVALTSHLEARPVEIDDQLPVPVSHKRQLDGEQLVELNFPNGATVVLWQSGSDNAQIKLLGKNGLKLAAKADRSYWDEAMSTLNRAYGNYDEKEARALERSMKIFRKEQFDRQAFELTIGGKSSVLEQMVQIFNLTMRDTQYPEDEELLDLLKQLEQRKWSKESEEGAGQAADSLLNDQLVQRLRKYNQQLKDDLSNSIIYIEGDLPENIEELVAKYIGSLPASSPQVVGNTGEVDHSEGSSGNRTKSWKRDLGKVEYDFRLQSDETVSMRDELILQGALEHAHLRMIKMLREKYGLIYGTGKYAGLSVAPQSSRMLRLVYMTDTANLEQTYTIMNEEVFRPLSRDELTEIDVVKMKAMLRSVYVMSFYDQKRISDHWLQSYFNFGKLYSPEELDQMIQGLSKEELESCVRQMIDFDHCWRTTTCPES